MSKILLKLIPVIFFAVIFSYVLFNLDYPQSLTSATAFQLISFLIPLYLLITFILNLFLNFLPLAGISSLGLIILLTLKALDSLNLVTGGLTAVSVGLFISYFKKNKRGSLTNYSKIPTLTKLKKGK